MRSGEQITSHHCNLRALVSQSLSLRVLAFTHQSPAACIAIMLITVTACSCMPYAVEGPEQVHVHRKYSSEDAFVNVQVTLNSSKVIHVTDERFLSVAFTIGDMRTHWTQYNLWSKRLHTLAKGLYPSYLRLGGSRANFAIFKENTSDVELQKHFKNFTFTGKDWDQINRFSLSVGWNLIFDVNDFLRTHNHWNPTNFEALLDYNTKRNYTVAAWQIGNEPNAYLHTDDVNITALQVAEDYMKLRAVLNSRIQYADPVLIGPDVTNPRQKLGTSPVQFLQGFLSKCGDCTNVTTFHSYYLSSRTAELDDFINPSILDSLTAEITEIKDVVKKYRPSALQQIWLTETGDAVPGGVSGISDRFAGGFPYLDKLGVGAKHGLEVIMKQQFIGRFCGLVDDSTINPRPVYWVAYIHKQLVGQRVLNVTTNQQGMNTLRIYAHCTQTKNSKYDPGDVTVIVLNLDKAKHMLLKFHGVLANKNIDEYLLTPSDGDDGLHSRYISLNDIKLEMLANGSLPELKPRPFKPPQTVNLPPLTYGFYVFLKDKSFVAKQRHKG